MELISDSGKRRVLYKLPYYPDRIIQWAILQKIEPVFNSVFTDFTCASLPQRGIHYASKKLRTYLGKDYEGTKYCLTMDIRKFYASIDHNILKDLLKKKIRDKRLLRLLFLIIDSKNDVIITDLGLTEEEKELYNQQGKGIPVGSYLSQYLANFYLAFFDHWLKEELHCKYVIRYMDDLIILSDSKEFLHNARIQIQDYLWQNLKLEVKPNWQIFPVDARGIDFVGYRHYHGYTLVRKSTCHRIKTLMVHLKQKADERISPNEKEWHQWNSAVGWVVWANSYNLVKKYFLNETIIGINLYYYYRIWLVSKGKRKKPRKRFNHYRIIKNLSKHKFKYSGYNRHKIIHHKEVFNYG